MRAAIVGGLAVTGLLAVPGRQAEAIPAFARRHEYACGTCHQFQFPRLNAFGRRFRDNGFQLPDGAEDRARARRMIEPGTTEEQLTVFKEVPLSVRGEVFGEVQTAPDATGEAPYDARMLAFLIGGGTVARDVSFFFSWTPFPTPSVHHARVGLHNLGAGAIGRGTLNLRAGYLFVLDFQRPGHRNLGPGPSDAIVTTVGLNAFALDFPTPGVELYGRPGWGPVRYELAVVAGDPGSDGEERDDWKDLFGRVELIGFQDTSHEVRPGVFAYRGRSDIVTELGDATVAQRDDFWFLGGDLDVELDRFALFAMAYVSRHSDPYLEGGAERFVAWRAEAIWGPTRQLVFAVPYHEVLGRGPTAATDALDARKIGVQATHLIAPNAAGKLSWQYDLRADEAGAGVFTAVIDVAM